MKRLLTIFTVLFSLVSVFGVSNVVDAAPAKQTTVKQTQVTPTYQQQKVLASQSLNKLMQAIPLVVDYVENDNKDSFYKLESMVNVIKNDKDRYKKFSTTTAGTIALKVDSTILNFFIIAKINEGLREGYISEYDTEYIQWLEEAQDQSLQDLEKIRQLLAKYGIKTVADIDF
ncbi:hypothetical protein ABEV55_17460 [Aneurinibacillus thermoaerophilus]|uniref:hypothetical protein n=1 Tax=Aneurinibacillus thermoaerophilus TaxID=143495 RepID=UPI002E1FCF71|nr:hypothetical protein [Aneurinibacillus thermoaerophilus]